MKDEYPICEVCGEPITDDYFIEIEGECYHRKCVERSLDTWLENRRNDVYEGEY
jgi:hypothetical protein